MYFPTQETFFKLSRATDYFLPSVWKVIKFWDSFLDKSIFFRNTQNKDFGWNSLLQSFISLLNLKNVYLHSINKNLPASHSVFPSFQVLFGPILLQKEIISEYFNHKRILEEFIFFHFRRDFRYRYFTATTSVLKTGQQW